MAVIDRMPLHPSAISKLKVPSAAVNVVPTAWILMPRMFDRNPTMPVMMNCRLLVACSTAPIGMVKIRNAHGKSTMRATCFPQR